MSPRTESAQSELELSADLDELRQLRRQLDRLAVGHEFGTAFEDGDASLVVEVGAKRHPGASGGEQRPADGLRDDAVLAANLGDVEVVHLMSGEQRGVLVLEPLAQRDVSVPG